MYTHIYIYIYIHSYIYIFIYIYIYISLYIYIERYIIYVYGVVFHFCVFLFPIFAEAKNANIGPTRLNSMNTGHELRSGAIPRKPYPPRPCGTLRNKNMPTNIPTIY